MKTQEQENKKAYEAPLAEPVALDDEALDAAAGGNQEEHERYNDLEGDFSFYESMTTKYSSDIVSGAGEERGGGCDHVLSHRTARNFSSGRNSGC